MPIVAALPIAIIAILALLLVYAFAVFGKAVLAMIPKSGFPGAGFLHNAVGLAITTAVNFVDNLLSPLMIHAVNLIMAPITMVEKFVVTIESAIAETITTLNWVYSEVIPAAYTDLTNHFTGLFAQAVAYARSLYTAAYNEAHRLYWLSVAAIATALATAKAYSLALYHDAYDEAHRLYWLTVSATAAALATAKAFTLTEATYLYNEAHRLYVLSTGYADAKIAALLGHVEQEVQAGVLLAGQQAVTTAGILITDVEKAASGALAASWPAVTDAVKGAEGAIDGGLDDILAGLKDIDLSLPTDLAGIAALTGTLAIPMLRFMEECGIPNCRNLSSLGRDLQALLGLVEDAAFVALIAELIHDPKGAAGDIVNTLGTLADDTISGAKDLLGVG